MIYDRTTDDVESARKIIREKVQKFLELTEEEIQTLEKGTMTVNTLNRIENKQEELKNRLNSIGYWNIGTTNKNWNNSLVFKSEELRRVIENVNVLRESFLVYKNTPTTPKAVYYYENINAVEKILNDLGVMIDDVKSKYRECGNFQCGEAS